MRVFDDMTTMIEEIRRDIYKSPPLHSSRVQANEIDLKVREAANYSYSFPGSSMPEDAYKLAQIGQKYFPAWGSLTEMVAWLAVEYMGRFNPLGLSTRFSKASEEYHPELKKHKEGGHYGYTYRERMIGAIPTMHSVLTKDRGSRRAYWPIFNQQDAHRASDYTRVPCTLGYDFMVREVEMLGPQLNVTILQRSCDFNTFWLSDLWFGHLFQKELAERLNFRCGLITHNIMSFHAFEDREIY